MTKTISLRHNVHVCVSSKTVPTCPEGQVYSICSPNLPPTCTDQTGQSDPCRPGCACPAGQVLKEGKCVDPTNCAGEDHDVYVEVYL